MIRNDVFQLANFLAEKLLEASSCEEAVEDCSTEEIPESFVSSEERSSEGIRRCGHQTSSIQDVLASLLQGQLLSQKPEQVADPAARSEIARIMGHYNPGDSDADEKAVEISKRQDLLPHLTTSERTNLVNGLFDGPTNEFEEDAAMDILRSASDKDLKKVVDSIGWERLTDELDSHDIDELSARLAKAGTNGSDPAVQGEINRLMKGFNDRMNGPIPSLGADDAAVEISKRKDLIKHLSISDREKLVMGLFDGTTNEGEEDAAMELLRSASNKDLKKLVDTIGWDRLSDELDPQDIVELSTRLAKS